MLADERTPCWLPANCHITAQLLSTYCMGTALDYFTNV
jgi:hypothetical protein